MRMKFCRIIACAVLVGLCVTSTQLLAQNFSVNQVKGAFYYKLTKFVRWKTPTVRLCFMNEKEDQAGATLAKTVSTLSSKDKGTYTITPNINIKDIKNCEMLFISAKSEPNLQDILAILDGHAVVTVSDIDSFTRRGGMFGLFERNGTVNVELNLTNAKKQNIDLNSALQEMISVVR